jgi:hypothetical protein
MPPSRPSHFAPHPDPLADRRADRLAEMMLSARSMPTAGESERQHRYAPGDAVLILTRSLAARHSGLLLQGSFYERFRHFVI